MKYTASGFLLAGFCSLSLINWTQAEPGGSGETASAKASHPAWLKADQAQAEAQEAKAQAEKVRALTNLQESVLKQKNIEQLFKAELEEGLAKEATHKAEHEAKRAAANAATSEAKLRDLKAKTEMRALEQASQAICDAKLAQAKAEKMESELKLLRIEQDRLKLVKEQ